MTRAQLAGLAIAAGLVVIQVRAHRASEATATALARKLDGVLAHQRALASTCAPRATPAAVAALALARPAPATPPATPPSSGAPATSTAPPEAAAAASPADHARRREAWEAVDAIIAKRSWTEDDRRRLGPLFRQLDADERERVLTTLIDAMNRGDVAPSDVELL